MEGMRLLREAWEAHPEAMHVDLMPNIAVSEVAGDDPAQKRMNETVDAPADFVPTYKEKGVVG